MAKIKEIHTNTRAQIDAILTTEQKNQLKAAIEKRKAERQQRQRKHHSEYKKKGNIFNSLNLTDKQKDQIKQIYNSERQKIQALLTPQQQAQMKKFQEEMRFRRQQRNPQ
ncbi:MAG: hypothetical protein ACKO86_25160 [Dolichospermum sp.]